MVCPHGQGGLSQCGQGGGGQYFSILCGRLLWTVPIHYSDVPARLLPSFEVEDKTSKQAVRNKPLRYYRLTYLYFSGEI